MNYQFQHTFTPNNHAYQSNSPSTRLLAITPYLEVRPIADDLVFLLNTQTQKTLVLQHNSTVLLDTLRVFRSATEHADDLINSRGLAKTLQPEILTLIDQLDQHGFLIDADEIITALQASQPKNPNTLTAPPTVVIRTANRVAMFKRLLESAAQNEARFYANYHYLIIDDSDETRSEANATACAQSSLNITHVPRAKQQQILTTLLTQLPEQQNELQFLLGNHPLHRDSPTYGRSWNWAILLSAGQAVVMLDDDCLLQCFASPLTMAANPSDNPTTLNANEELSFKNSNKSIAFLDPNTALQTQLKMIAADPIALLASPLGKHASQFKLSTQSLYLASNQLYCYVSDNLAQIKIATQGVAGEPGSASNQFLFNLDDPSLNALLGEDETDYQRHKTQRFAYVGYPELRLNLSGSHSMVARALDNRQLLPATLPIFRNEDALFTHLVGALYPAALNLEYPFAMAHLPEAERRWQDGDLDKPINFDLTGAIAALLGDVKQILGAPVANSALLPTVAQLLEDLSALDDAAFARYVYREQQSHRAAQLHGWHQELKSRADSPEYYQRDLIRQIEANSQAEQPLLVSELDYLRNVLNTYAQSLRLWPQLWEHATQNQRNNKSSWLD